MALVILFAIAGLVVTVAVVVFVTLRNTRRAADDELRFDATVHALTCRIEAGNVSVIGRDEEGSVVRRSLRHGWRAPATVERVDGVTLEIEVHRPTGFLAGWWWVEYEIEIPRTASVAVRTAAGRVNVDGMRAAVDVHTEAGKVHVHDVEGALRLHAGAGPVDGDGLRSRAVDVKTGAGHVRLVFDAEPDHVAVAAAAGAVEVRLPGGPYNVDVASSAGRTRVEVPTSPEAPHTVTARSAAGAVRVAPRAVDPSRVALVEEALDGPSGRALVDALLIELESRYGEEDADAPQAADLAPPDGTFVVARLDGRVVGCGGLRRTGDGEGEIKRMYVVPDARRLGVGARVLAALEAEARRRGLARLRLETGVRQPEAIALYERAGYTRIDPFPPYVDAPMSVCYAKELPDV